MAMKCTLQRVWPMCPPRRVVVPPSSCLQLTPGPRSLAASHLRDLPFSVPHGWFFPSVGSEGHVLPHVRGASFLLLNHCPNEAHDCSVPRVT